MKLRKATISFVMSVRPPAWNFSAQTEQIFMKFNIFGIFPKSVQKIQVSLKCDFTGYFAGRPMYIYDISLNSS